MRSVRAATVTLLAFFMVGCDAPSSAPGRSGAGVRDSAGVEIVEIGSVSYDDLPQWRLADRPRLDIGVVEGEEPYMLHQVGDARVFRDGSIVLTAVHQVRKFDSTGTHLWSQGQEGDGPGSYRSPYRLSVLAGDSVLVGDGRSFSILDPRGEFVRVVRVRPERVTAGPQIEGATPDGDVLVWECGRVEYDGGGPYRENRIMCDAMILDMEGRFQRSLGQRMLHRDLLSRSGQLMTEEPWEPSPVRAVAPDGSWYGSGRDGYELRFYAGSSEPRRIVRWDGPDLTVTAEDVRSYDEKIESQGAPSPALQFEKSIPKPERIPPYRQMVVDHQGRPWLRDYERWDEEWPPLVTRWTVLSPDGTELLGRLEHDSGVRLLDAGEGWVLVRELDEFDVEHVRKYDLVELTNR